MLSAASRSKGYRMNRQSVSINLVKELKTRSLLRGLLNRGETRSHVKTLNNLREAASPGDAEKVAELLINSPLFSHLSSSTDFPIKPITARDCIRLNDQSLEAELTYQCIRIKKHCSRLLEAFGDLQQLNEAMLSRNGTATIQSIKRFIQRHGYSNVILLKLAYTLAQFGSDVDIASYCNEELEKYGTTRRYAIALGAVDMMDEVYPFITLRKNILDCLDPRQNSPISHDIVNSLFRPIRSQRRDLAAQMQSHGMFSVLDVTMFMFIHRYNVAIFEAVGVANIMDRYIDQHLYQRWIQLATSGCPSSYVVSSDDPEFDDETFYRRSIAFIEYSSVSQFRNGIDPYYIDNKSQPIIRSIESLTFATAYFRRATSLSAISAEPRAFKMRLDKYENASAGAFIRTIAFIHLLRSGARSTEISAPQMLSLLNNTTRIAELAHIEELRSFFDSPHKDSLVNYLAQAVMSDCSQQNIEQHKLRRALQEIVLERFEGDLIAFAAVLWASSKNVALHLWELCNEAFLVQLFFLFKEPEMVFEARAQILEWYARRFHDASVLEWAKTLRLDQKLRKIRG